MPRIQKPQSVVSPELILTNKLITEFRQLWVDQLKEAGVNHMTYSRLSLVALMQVAAAISVDISMQPKQFAAMALGSFEEAHRKAPRFS
jgi:ribosomal protein L20